MFNSLIEISKSFITSFGNFVSSLVGALLIFIVGFIIARFFKWSLTKIFYKLKLEDYADQLGINEFLSKAGFKNTITTFTGKVIYYFIMVIVLTAVFNTLGLDMVSDLLTQIMLFIPNIIVSIIVFILGLKFADIVENIIENSLDTQYEHIISKGSKYLILLIVFSIIMNQIGIGTNIILTIVQAIFGGLGLGFAIALGLGSKDFVASKVKDITNYKDEYDRKIYKEYDKLLLQLKNTEEQLAFERNLQFDQKNASNSDMAGSKRTITKSDK